MEPISERRLNHLEQSLEHKRREIERARNVVTRNLQIVTHREHQTTGEFSRIKESLLSLSTTNPRIRMVEAKNAYCSLQERNVALTTLKHQKKELTETLAGMCKFFEVHDAKVERIHDSKQLIRLAHALRTEASLEEDTLAKVALSLLHAETDSVDTGDEGAESISITEGMVAGKQEKFLPNAEAMHPISCPIQLEERVSAKESKVPIRDEATHEISSSEITSLSVDIKTSLGGRIGLTAQADSTQGIDMLLTSKTVQDTSALRRVRTQITDATARENILIRRIKIVHEEEE